MVLIMKATGVVRRIDDLGRIVIPKEIRKVLRIKEGDPLEVFTDREGQVILKKYSPIGELSEFAAGYAETLSKTTGHIACITDKDTVIAVSGGSKKEFLEQDVSPELEQLMEDKEVYTSKENSDVAMPITKNDNQERKYNAQVVYPIISNGDTIGTVILMSKEANQKIFSSLDFFDEGNYLRQGAVLFLDNFKGNETLIKVTKRKGIDKGESNYKLLYENNINILELKLQNGKALIKASQITSYFMKIISIS